MFESQGRNKKAIRTHIYVLDGHRVMFLLSVQEHIQGQLKFKKVEKDYFLIRIVELGGIELVLLGILLMIYLAAYEQELCKLPFAKSNQLSY